MHQAVSWFRDNKALSQKYDYFKLQKNVINRNWTLITYNQKDFVIVKMFSLYI